MVLNILVYLNLRLFVQIIIIIEVPYYLPCKWPSLLDLTLSLLAVVGTEYEAIFKK